MLYLKIYSLMSMVVNIRLSDWIKVKRRGDEDAFLNHRENKKVEDRHKHGQIKKERRYGYNLLVTVTHDAYKEGPSIFQAFKEEDW